MAFVLLITIHKKKRTMEPKANKDIQKHFSQEDNLFAAIPITVI